MKDASDLPRIAEPWFLALNASIEATPAMIAEDLQKAAPAIEQAVKTFGYGLGAARLGRTALDLMFWGGPDGTPLDYDEAARTANLTVRSMRRALERPNVRQYLRTQRDVFRARISARVIHRLDELSQQNTNMNAAVGASRVFYKGCFERYYALFAPCLLR
jgi:hypothetical protein